MCQIIETKGRQCVQDNAHHETRASESWPQAMMVLCVLAVAVVLTSPVWIYDAIRNGQ